MEGEGEEDWRGKFALLETSGVPQPWNTPGDDGEFLRDLGAYSVGAVRDTARMVWALFAQVPPWWVEKDPEGMQLLASLFPSLMVCDTESDPAPKATLLVPFNHPDDDTVPGHLNEEELVEGLLNGRLPPYRDYTYVLDLVEVLSNLLQERVSAKEETKEVSWERKAPLSLALAEHACNERWDLFKMEVRALFPQE